MTPPISKDWWLAAAISTATLPAAMAQGDLGTAPTTGVVTAVAPGGKVTDGNNEVVVAGSSIVAGQRLRTDANGLLHVLLLDQSALTLGPDSELTVEEFSFDPATHQGQIRLGLTKGLVRVVGGQISKNTPTLIATPHGKIEILGGIVVAENTGQKTSAAYLFGQSMRISDNNGNTETITRPGFGTSIGDGTAPIVPQRVPVSDLSAQLQRLETRPGTTGGANLSQSAPAPAGQLISTGNQPGGANNPGGLSNDRLKEVIDTSQGANPSQTLRDILGITNPIISS